MEDAEKNRSRAAGKKQTVAHGHSQTGAVPTSITPPTIWVQVVAWGPTPSVRAPPSAPRGAFVHTWISQTEAVARCWRRRLKNLRLHRRQRLRRSTDLNASTTSSCFSGAIRGQPQSSTE